MNATSDNRPRPFLTVVIRTTGARSDLLGEALRSLVGQSCDDFDVVIVLHRVAGHSEAAMAAVRDAVPAEIAGRVRLVPCERPGRAAPLNAAIEHLTGRYVAHLDDDDFALADWVAAFRDLEVAEPGKLLRTVCYNQDWRLEVVDGVRRVEAVGPRVLTWPLRYDAITHLRRNQSPFMTLAFPVALFTQHGMRFDETLSTLEDWQFATLAAMRVGVASSERVTAVYRWWVNGESSSFAHSRAEWDANERRVFADFDRISLTLPPGSASRLRELLEIEHRWLRSRPAARWRRLKDKVKKALGLGSK